MSPDDFDFDTLTTPGDDAILAGLHRSVAGAAMTTSVADVVALGRRTRTRHRAVAAGIGTGAAAVVAAIGMLAPSAGTGTGSGSGSGSGGVPNAVAQGAVSTTMPTTGTSATGEILTIQEAGFSLEEHADGTVLLSLSDIFDPAKLQAALDRAGIPATILVRPVPDGWDLKHGGIQCTPDPGVHVPSPEIGGLLKDVTPGRSPKIVLNKSEIPAGDYITLERFESHGQIVAGSFSIKVGKQTTCVPQHMTLPGENGK